VLATHVQEARADRREQPLVKAHAVVVAFEVAQLVGEMREGVRPVHDRLDPAGPRHACNVPHRKDLPGEVRDVAEMNDLRLRRNCLLEA
jgi:hypothetical protein